MELTASNVSVKIGDQTIIDHVSFAAKSGECIGLIGPNGSGKSTLLRALCGLLAKEEGEIWVGEKEISSIGAKELARKVGYVPQDTSIGFDFLVNEMVLMGRHAHLPRFGVEGPVDYDIVRQVMERTAIAHLANRPVTRLSGGQRQMVFIAKALAQQPSIYLFDEPVSALDINRQLQVLELIRALADEGALTITAIHDLNLASRYCDRLIMLHNGQIIASGTPEEVLKSEVLQASYGVLAAVRRDPLIDADTVTAMSLMDKQTAAKKRMKRVHVIGGAGKAAALLKILYQLPVHVTVGPIEEHDPDARLAQELGMDVRTYPSFSILSEQELHDGKEAVAAADLTLAVPVPCGDSNQRLSEVLKSTKVYVYDVSSSSNRQSILEDVSYSMITTEELLKLGEAN